MMIKILISIPIILLILIRIYIKFNAVWCRSKVCLIGKTVIVTGANSGVGFQVALDYASRGARVILACRNQSKAIESKRKIIQLTNNKNIVTKSLDVNSFKSIRAFVDDILSTEINLHILVNNAGMYGLSQETSEDGLNTCLQTNYYGHFLLTILLIELLRKSGPSRIVNVSSKMAEYGTTETINPRHPDGSLMEAKTYSDSKLYQILFTQELAKRLIGTDISVYSVHPGTSFGVQFYQNSPAYFKFFMPLLRYLSNTYEEIAQSVIYAGISQGLEMYSGSHITGCRVVKPYKSASNQEKFAQKLWDTSIQLVKLKPEEVDQINTVRRL